MKDLTPEQAAQQFLDNLGPEGISELKNSIKAAMDSLIQSEEAILSDLLVKKSSLEKERADLYEKEKTLPSSEKYEIFNKRQELAKEISLLTTPIRNQQNIVLAVKNGGDLAEIEDKKSNKYTKVPSFLNIKTDIIKFDIETILTDVAPAYVPVINEESFRRRGYVFDALRIGKDIYLFSTNGYSSNGASGFVLVNLDQLALISDYYFLKEKAKLQKDADDQNKRADEGWDRLPEERRKTFLEKTSPASLYASMPLAKRKLISLDEWKTLSWQGKEKIHKFVKHYGPKRMVSKLEDNSMWVSYHEMYEWFVNADAKPRGTYANPETFAYWRHFREMLDWKIKDIQVERETDSEVRKMALETSFGDSNISDVLRPTDGIYVKRQDGSKIKPVEVDQIKTSFEEVEKIFGPLSLKSSEYGLKISHTGTKYVFASKAVGMFVPDMKAIAVSNKFGPVQFTQTLAHELAHWIDSSVSGSGRYASGNYESTAGQIAYTVKKGMNKKSDSKYINNSAECFARGFEQYFAVETHGEDARLQYSYVALDGNIPYFIENNYVSKALYEEKLKPLVVKFLEENKEFFKAISASTTEAKEISARDNIKEIEVMEEMKKNQDAEDKYSISKALSKKTDEEKKQVILILNKGGFIGDPIIFYKNGKIYKGKTKLVRENIKPRGGGEPTKDEIKVATKKLEDKYSVKREDLFNLTASHHYGNWVLEADIVVSPKKISMEDAEFEVRIRYSAIEEVNREMEGEGKVVKSGEISTPSGINKVDMKKENKVESSPKPDSSEFKNKYGVSAIQLAEQYNKDIVEKGKFYDPENTYRDLSGNEITHNDKDEFYIDFLNAINDTKIKLRKKIEINASGILSYKEIELPPYKKSGLGILSKVASDDELRPALNGVFVDNGSLVATDGHQIIIIKNNDYKSKNNKILNIKTGEVIDERFPDYKNAIPDPAFHETIKFTGDINLAKLISIVNGAKDAYRNIKLRGSQSAIMTLEFNGRINAVNPFVFINGLQAFQASGAKSVKLGLNGLSKRESPLPILIYADNGNSGLIMPMITIEDKLIASPVKIEDIENQDMKEEAISTDSKENYDLVRERIEKLNPYEAEGYNVVRLRELKEAMLENLPKAKSSFEIMDFAKIIWHMDKDFQKHPLTHLGMFFYGESNSVEEFVDNQITAIQGDIESNKKYLVSLKSKKDVKSKAFWKEALIRKQDNIEEIKKAYSEYKAIPMENKNKEEVTNSGKVDIKNLHYKFPSYNPVLNLEKYTPPVGFTSVYPLTDSHLFHSEHGWRVPARLTYSDGKIKVDISEHRKDIEVSVRELHEKGFKGMDNIEKESSHLDLQLFDNETDLNNYLLSIRDRFKSSYLTIDELMIKHSNILNPSKVKLKSLLIHWAEGNTSKYDKFPKEYPTWEAANKAVMPIYNDILEEDIKGTYNKVKFTATFEDGETYDGRLDVSEKYDNPTSGNVFGRHIKDFLDHELRSERVSEESKKEINEFLEKYDLGLGELKIENGKLKVFNIQYNVGKSKYVINFHDGVKKHSDGSAFFDIATFNNKESMNEFVNKLKNEGYLDEKSNAVAENTEIPLWKKEVSGYKRVKDAIPHVNAIEEALDNGMYEKAIESGELTALKAAEIIDSAGWIVPEMIQLQAYPQAMQPDNTAESFSDCLKRNGINLEKDRHKFEIGTVIKENESGIKYKVVDFGVNNFIMSSFSLFSKEAKTVEVPYDMVIDHFIKKSISVDGFYEEEIMEFARVINTIQHCKKMDLLAIENEKLKIKNDDNLGGQVYKMEDYEIDAKMKMLLKEKEAGNWDDNTHRIYMYLASEKNRRGGNKLSEALLDAGIANIKEAEKALPFHKTKTSELSIGQEVLVNDGVDKGIVKDIQGVDIYVETDKGTAVYHPSEIVLIKSEEVKPSYISTDTMIDSILSKSENSGFLKSGKYSNSESGVIAYIRAQKELHPNEVIVLFGVNTNDIVKRIYNTYNTDNFSKYDYEEKYGIDFTKKVDNAISKTINEIIKPDIEVVIDTPPVNKNKTIASLKVLLSMEKDKDKKKEIKAEIKKLSA